LKNERKLAHAKDGTCLVPLVSESTAIQTTGVAGFNPIELIECMIGRIDTWYFQRRGTGISP